MSVMFSITFKNLRKKFRYISRGRSGLSDSQKHQEDFATVFSNAQAKKCFFKFNYKIENYKVSLTFVILLRNNSFQELKKSIFYYF